MLRSLVSRAALDSRTAGVDRRGERHVARDRSETPYSLSATPARPPARRLWSPLEPALPALRPRASRWRRRLKARLGLRPGCGRLVHELSCFGGHWQEVRAHARPRQRPRRLRGSTSRTLTSGDNLGPHFGHFLPDALGRLAIAERAGFALGDFDHVLLPPARSPGARTLVSRLGLQRERLPHDRTRRGVCRRRALRSLVSGRTVAVLGRGGRIPPWLGPSVDAASASALRDHGAGTAATP